MWDWDEALFALGVRSYDVTQHNPHPPGFPLYVALGKFFRLFMHSDFHALQAINVIGAIALFPLLLWLALELRFAFRTAYLGALLFVFLPNVWFFGGTAFSDIPALALTIAACAALLQGCESRRAYFAGALLLGLAAAIRPQELVIGFAPAIYCSWRRKSPKEVAVASAIGAAVLVVAYGGAALASDSVSGYFDTVARLRLYVRRVDSFLNPARPPVVTLLPDFFVHAIPGRRAATIISALAACGLIIGVIRRSFSVAMLVAMFLPFNVIGLFMLDINSISRYSIGFAPMYVVLAVYAVELLTLPVQAILVIAAIGRLVWWTAPAIEEVRRTQSPPAALMQWARDHLPKSQPVFIHGSIAPFCSYFLSDHDVRDHFGIADRGWFLTEGATADIEGVNFARPRETLSHIVRARYFETSASPLAGRWFFGAGWYGAESVGQNIWRWMGAHSETLLPPIGGNAQLTLQFDLPTELVARHPTVDIYLNGQRVDQVLCTTKSIARTTVVPSRGDALNQLVITIDKVLNPAKEHILPDARDLGLELTGYGWKPIG